MEHSNLGKWSLSPDARQKMVNKIMDTLQKHMPLTAPEGMNDLKKIALRFEEKIYNAAADQQDYLRKISLKMLSLKTRSQVPGRNAPGSGQKPLDTATTEPSTQIGHVDIQENIYQRQQKLKEMYFADMKELYMKLQSQSELDSISKELKPLFSCIWGEQSSAMEHSNVGKLSLSPDSRQKMVNKITGTLQKHMPLTGPEGMNDLKKIALRFEEKIYIAAADQQDYLRKISLKMLSLETRNQVPGGNSPVSNPKPLDTGLIPKGWKLPPCHPTYLQMITEAITSLKEGSGSSYYAITRYIDAKYKTQLPANYKKLLTGQLRKLAKSGKLTKVKASFKVPAELNWASKRKSPMPVKAASARKATKNVASKPKAAAKAPAEVVKAPKVPKEKKTDNSIVKKGKIAAPKKPSKPVGKKGGVPKAAKKAPMKAAKKTIKQTKK